MIHLRSLLLSILIFAVSATVAAAAPRFVPVFVDFIKEGDYEQANYYVEQGYIEQGDIDPAQVLFQVIDDKFRWRIVDNLPAIDVLIGYLANFGEYNFNKSLTCGDGPPCGFAGRLISTGQPTYIIEKFVEMGMDLNHTVPGRVQNELHLIVHLGSVYTLDDLNRLVALGLNLGSQTFTVQNLLDVSYNQFYNARDYRSSQISMPEGYGSLRGFNFLDTLVLVIGSLRASTEAYNDGPSVAAKTDFLCSFALHAAPSYTTSFDYLNYLLMNRTDFRPRHMGYREVNSRTTFIPFPDSCVTLITAMAANHADIRRIIDSFAASGDTATAAWLQSISGPGANAQPAPAQ